jgi:hypothetical protein
MVGSSRIVCADPRLFAHPPAAMTRLLVLLIAALFVVGFAYLTLHTIVAQKGLSAGTAISVFVVVLMGVGIVGALLNPPRR